MKHLIFILLSIGFASFSASAQISEKAEDVSSSLIGEIITDVELNVPTASDHSTVNILNKKPSESGFATENNNAGITFHQGSWDEVLKLAKKENKMVFLDISASWCGPCKMLKANTFPNQEVGKFYNANFINVAVDGEKGEGVTLARKYKISGYPSLLFINPEGKIIAQTAGYRNPEQFIELGKQIVK